MPNTDYAFVNYPLSQGFRRQFEQTTASAPRYLTLSELRRQSLGSMLRRLSQLRADRLFIPLESRNSASLLPVFYCLAGLTRARSIELVEPDFQRRNISRWTTAKSWASMIKASVEGRVSVRRCRRELQMLANETRINADPVAYGRVLYLKSNLWLDVKAGGSIGHVAGVVNGMAANGLQVDYAGADPPLMFNNPVPFHHLAPTDTYGFPYEVNLYRFHDKMVRRLRNVLRNGRHSFIYQRMSVSNYAGVILSREMQIPLILEYNGSEVWVSDKWSRRPRNYDVTKLAEEICLRHAHVVVTVSEVLREELIERGVEPERIVCYPNCVDPQTYNPDRFTSDELLAHRRNLGIESDANIIAFFGTFGPWHGVEVLARAIRQLVLEDVDFLQQNRVHFLIVGDGLKMPEVARALDDDCCRPFVSLPGLVPQNEAPKYLAISDVLVSPHVNNTDGSRFFGSPTKLFEYMAMQKPVLASNLEQIGEVLKDSLQVDDLPAETPADSDSRLAMLTPPGDIDALAKGIRFLVQRPDWRKHLARNARSEALARYTWDKHVGAILERVSSIGKSI